MDVGLEIALSKADAHVVQKPTLSIVYVCFQSGAALDRALNFLRLDKLTKNFVQAIVVNNSSGDASDIQEITERYGAQLVHVGSNLGFGRGCNVGFQHATAEVVAFLNPDIMMTTGSFKVLRDRLLSETSLVAVGPAIFDGARKRKIKRRSSSDPRGTEWFLRVWTWLQRSSSKSTLWWTGLADLFARRVNTPVRFIPGCAFFVRTDAFRRIGGFDEGFFLYCEDDDLSIRLATLGGLERVPSAVALHRHGQSTSDGEGMRLAQAWHQGFSTARALRKHRGEVGRFIAAYQILLRALSPINLASRRYRKKTVAYMMGGWHALMPQAVPSAPLSVNDLPGLI